MTKISGMADAPARQGESQAKLTSDFNAFLKMLTTQLQNQDPLKPMDAAQFTQQLVSFSQVEQQIQQTSKLQQLLDRMAASDLATATSLIGQRVEFAQPTALLTDQGAHWSYRLAGSAVESSLEIRDSKGKTVRILSGETAKGEHDFAWDGTLANGSKAPSGVYTLVVTAKASNNAEIKAEVYGQAVVDSVGLSNGAAVVNMGAMSVPLTELRRVG